MSIREFRKKYSPIKYGGLKQASIDLFERIEDALMDAGLRLDDRIGVAHYSITTALEVYNDELKDRTWLVDMYNDLKEINEE